ncbi:hypothetical protein RRG08_032670 [Elysia crispata]|uniref:Uncharacterized protein n=1 Tax=Elysia crispata TaxID=231223 RepID=A0AAE1CQ20_9GAST|nr:hypothetical protein RRG08_032670 [Elysia crispata]
MSQSEKVSFEKILGEYVNIHPRLTGNSLQGDYLQNVSIHIRHHRIPTTTGDASLVSADTVQQAVVDNGEAGPSLKTESSLENKVKFEILRGYCEDFPHKEVKFELPRGHGKVKVHLNKGKQEVSSGKVEVALSSSSGNGAKAMVMTKTDEQPVRFFSKVYLRGKVLFNNGEVSVPTQDIIRQLTEKRSETVKDFQGDDEGFYWFIEGICHMKMGVMHAHNWS